MLREMNLWQYGVISATYQPVATKRHQREGKICTSSKNWNLKLVIYARNYRVTKFESSYPL